MKPLPDLSAKKWSVDVYYSAAYKNVYTYYQPVSNATSYST